MRLCDLTVYGKRKEAARILRHRETDAEEILWERLRNRQLNGLKFRRQFPIGPYFTDFCCLQKRLVVELDGDPHAMQADPDHNRTRYFKQQGFRVLRFLNVQVLNHLDSVCETISRRSPLPMGEGSLPKATG